MKLWSHLPNAPLIDWVLESLRTDPKNWDAALDAARAVTRAVTRDAAWDAAWDATWDAARAAARHATWDATWDVILALVAYDDCDEYLSMSYEQLLAWAQLSERPQAVLLLPLKWIQEHETLVTSA